MNYTEVDCHVVSDKYDDSIVESKHMFSSN